VGAEFVRAIEDYLADMRTFGRLSTDRSAQEYRRVLGSHAEDAASTDPAATTREDVKSTLRRWSHPNTQRRRRSVLVSFYDWLVEEGVRLDNPARQTRSPRGRQPRVKRMTLEEVRLFLAAARTRTERRVAYLGVCAGLRRNELRQLQGRHFARAGLIWVSGDIAKGGRERWVPVIGDLAPVVEEIRALEPPEDYVVPGAKQPCHAKTIWRIVRRIGQRAGIPYSVHPHMLRHAFASQVTRVAGVHIAQALLGHASIQTTQGYLAQPSLDELAQGLRGMTFAS
jgi:site-specific recombinase XerD